MEKIFLKCSCGKVRGEALDIEPSKCLRCVCYCDDCQAYAQYLSRAKDLLDANGGTDIVPMRPSNLKITHGIENVRGMRLGDKGMFRWFAECCNTPIANLPPSPKLPYAGLAAAFIDSAANGKSIDETVGPIQYRLQAKFAHGTPPKESSAGAPLGFILRVIPFFISGMIGRKSSPNPFIDPKTGNPSPPVDLLTKERRSKFN